MSSAAPPVPPPPKPRRRRALVLVLVLVLMLMALLAAIVAGAAAWIWRTSDGLVFAIAAADRLLPARLHARAVSGSLAHGFAADELVYEDATVSVRITGLRATLDELHAGRSLAALRVGFDELLAERLTVRVRPPAVPAAAPPQSIALPFALRAERLAVGEFELHTGDDSARPLRLRAIAARVEAGLHGYAVTGGLAFGSAEAPLQAQFDAALGGAAPFALAGRGTLAGAVGAQPLQAAIEASGSLVDLRLQSEVVRAQAAAAPAADDPRGTLVARIAVFEAIALRELTVDFEGIDPAAWIAGAPHALLAVQAQLRPGPGVPFTLEGPIAVRNRAEGPVDHGRVPLRAGTARIALGAESLRLTDISAELARGRASGSFELAFAHADAWRAQAQFRGVDPSAMHSRLHRFSLDGQAGFAKQAGELVVRGQLRNRAATPLRASVELRASAQRVRIDSARLDLGRGQASFSGEVQLAAARALRLEGSVTDLDPSLLLAGLDGRLTGSFNVTGALAPQPSGTATFRIDDSRLLGRPLAGHGAATLAEHRLDLDVQLAIRSATLTARGALGAPAGTLALTLVAPQLGELGLPASGRLVASATLAGELAAPSVDAQIDAAALSIGAHRIATVQAVARYAGGSDGRFTLLATAAGHRFGASPALSLQSAVLRAEGLPSEHRIELRASNEELQPLELDLAGGWRVHEAGAPASWRGELRHALAGGPFDLRLLQPAPLRADLARWSLGPMELTAAGSRIEQLRVDFDDAYFSTSGRFSGLQPGALRGNGARIRPLAGGAPAHAPTTLRGHWQLRLGAQADGQFLVERSDGDIVAGAQAMGLTDLRLHAQLRANRLQAEARFAGTVAGRAQAQLAAEVERGDNGWRLAQQRPISATAEVDMPSIAWVNSLLSQAVRANVRIGGALRGHLRVQGTPAAPLAQGRFEGEALRAAWIEQGIRLEGGRLAAHIDGDRLRIDELRFPGPVTVEPADRRPARALARDAPGEPGFVAMTGTLGLRDRSGVVQVQAVRMPVLQRPDRWAVATGGANIVFDPRQVQLNGALVANAGFVDFSRPDLPTLSADVRVLRAAEPPAARESPLGINFDLGIDLGEAFYLRGAGLDTRVEGQLRLRAQGRGAIHATGALEARDGTYEGFGQRLAIERGRVNFHGPLENPGLDVLALRRGLPVEVGVAVTRTAADPLVRLHSAEPMTEQEMLTWLVLGRPPAATEAGADRLALATAAAGLLAGTGEGYGTQFARRIGIDELTLRTGEIVGGATLLPRATVAGLIRGAPTTPAGEIVTIGKRLTEDLTLSFERAASGTETLVQIIYRVSDRVSMVARAGTENALNLVYSIAFD